MTITSGHDDVFQLKKTYVLDTNVLLSDPTAIFAFDEHNVIVPLVVLEELDRQKNRPDDVGRNARQVSRTLDEMRGPDKSLFEGIELPTGGLLRIVSIDNSALQHVPIELQGPAVDNLLIALMMQLNIKECLKSQGHSPHILVSKDINVRLKCDALDVRCDDYLRMRVTDDPQKFYRGVTTLDVSEELIDEFYHTGKLQLPTGIIDQCPMYPNQIVIVKAVSDGQTLKSAITKCLVPGQPLVQLAKIEQAYGLRPRNKEQSFSLDLLFDDSVKLLTLLGQAGTGKTLLALASALEQLKGLGDPAKAKYDKLIVSRPVQPMGRDIGFLPGDIDEKMAPWLAPIRDNLNFLMNAKRNRPKRNRTNEGQPGGKTQTDDNLYLQMLQQKGLIEIEALTFIRGRSIPNAFIIVDEAQNLSIHELKTIITRAGDNTKLVLTGDINQIDNAHLDIFTNGLSHVVERFKEHSIAGHVTLIKGERSLLATLGSQVL